MIAALAVVSCVQAQYPPTTSPDNLILKTQILWDSSLILCDRVTAAFKRTPSVFMVFT